MNQQRAGALLKQAGDYGVAGAEPCLIAPKSVVRQSESGGIAAFEERLPAVSCMAVFNSGELAQEDSDPYSSLAVVWFQDRFALTIAPEVEEALRDIAWVVKSKDWCT